MNVDELNGIAEEIYDIASSDERARREDKYLIWQFHQREYRNLFGKPFPITFDEYNKLTPTDSITRIRRKLQKDGMIPAAVEAQKDRAEKKSKMRDWARRSHNGLLF